MEQDNNLSELDSRGELAAIARLTEQLSVDCSVRQLLTISTDCFTTIPSMPSARKEARVLVARLLECELWQLADKLESKLTPAQRARIVQAVIWRIRQKPLAHILARKEFYGRDFYLHRDCLVPRPETEMMVQLALAKLNALSIGQRSRLRLLDLGSGSGCIGISCLCELAAVHLIAIDYNFNCALMTKMNAIYHQVANRCAVICADWLEASGQAAHAGKFDAICINAPYVTSKFLAKATDLRQESRLALDGGRDGMQQYRRIIINLTKYLNPRGTVFMELMRTQLPILAAILAETTLIIQQVEYEGRVACVVAGIDY